MREQLFKRRDSDETVNRRVDIHFPHLTASERLNKTDGAGLNIRQRISKDKKALKKGQRLSSAYYRDLALEYPADDPVQSLEPKNAGEQVAPQLVQALKVMHNKSQNIRSVEPLVVFIRHASSLNETEDIGLLKLAFKP